MNDYAYGSYDPVTMEYTPPGPLTASLVANPTSGTLSLNSDGSFTYTPATGFFGSDSFTYEASDGTETSNVATVLISVMNSAPYAADDSFMTLHDQSLTASVPGVLMNDYDTDGDPITPTLVTGTSNGTLTFNSDGSFTYAPNAGFVGSDSFTYKVSDGLTDSNAATVSISVMNSAPYAGDDSFMTTHDQSFAASVPGVLINDYDTDGDPITPTLLASTSNGTLTFNSDGSFTYVPNAGYVGNDSFTYKVSDGLSDSNTATVSISVMNSAPTFAPIAYFSHGDDLVEADTGDWYDGLKIGQLIATDSDGDALVYSAPSSSLVSVDSNGGVWLLNADAMTTLLEATGNFSLPVSVTDGIVAAASLLTLDKHFPWIPQSYMQITTSNGHDYYPTSAADLIITLNMIQGNGEKVTYLLIKGHGGPDGIALGNGANPPLLTVAIGGGANTIDIDGTDVTALLNNLTDANTVITLRGCHTLPLAKKLKTALGGDTPVYGNRLWKVIGIPGTGWEIGF